MVFCKGVGEGLWAIMTCGGGTDQQCSSKPLNRKITWGASLHRKRGVDHSHDDKTLDSKKARVAPASTAIADSPTRRLVEYVRLEGDVS